MVAESKRKAGDARPERHNILEAALKNTCSERPGPTEH